MVLFLGKDLVKETWRTFDLVAHVYRRRSWDIIDRVINGSISVFGDIGSGPGHNALRILDLVAGSRGVVVDISYNMVYHALKRSFKRGVLWRMACIQSDMVSLPFRDGSMDLLIYVASIHHLPFRRLRLKALEEAYRVLRRGGRILVTVWARYQLSFMHRLLGNIVSRILGRIESIGDVMIPWRHRGENLYRYYHLYTLRELRRDLETVGFRVMESGTYYPVRRRFKPTKNYYAIALKT